MKIPFPRKITSLTWRVVCWFIGYFTANHKETFQEVPQNVIQKAKEEVDIVIPIHKLLLTLSWEQQVPVLQPQIVAGGEEVDANRTLKDFFGPTKGKQSGIIIIFCSFVCLLKSLSRFCACGQRVSCFSSLRNDAYFVMNIHGHHESQF